MDEHFALPPDNSDSDSTPPDPVAMGAEAARQLLKPEFSVEFSDKGGPYEPGDSRRKEQHYSEPHEVRIRDNLITELEDKNKKLNELATKDSLTSLLTRRALEEAYEGIRGESSLPVDRRRHDTSSNYILITDVDDFKTINDTKGHDEGDRILVALAESLRKNVRKQDFVGRWGGDENVALLPGATRERAHEVAQALIHGARDKGITISIGVSKLSFDKVDGTLAETVKNADEALKVAKKAGKNIVVDFDQLSQAEPS